MKRILRQYGKRPWTLSRSRRSLLIVFLVAVVVVVVVSVGWFGASQVWLSPTMDDSSSPSKGTQAGVSSADVDNRRPVAAPHADDATSPLAAVTSRRTTAPTGQSSSRFANGAANRSPVRPKRRLPDAASSSNSFPAGVLGGGAKQSALSEWEKTAACYDRSGSPTAVPKWYPPLVERLGAAYEAVQEAAETDPWQILIGWVPSRFMGPQKPGRKANGDLMIPPTKGRNASVYWDEYNASWHGSVEANGYEYQFQLVHRNALAVCIRERLHVMQLYCVPRVAGEGGGGAAAAPGGKILSKPLIVYHCPCRHCREGHVAQGKEGTSSAARRLTMDKQFPTYRSPLLRALVSPTSRQRLLLTGPYVDPKAVTPPGCVDDLAAPWLVSRDSVERFPYEGLETDLDTLLRVQADINRIVLVTIFNKFWIDHLHNFVYSMVTRGRVVNYIVATMDDEALALCIRNRLPCFDATAFAEFEADMVDGGVGQKTGHTRKVSEAMSWIKPRLAVAVLSRGYGFLMSDLDLTWNRSPWKDMLDVRVDIAHQCDTNNKFSINSGFYFARANDRTVRFFHNLMVFTPEENSDQTAMKLFAKYDHTHGASNTCLHKWTFNMKCNYKVEGSVKVQHGVETFEWMPYDGKNEFWTILHATCLAGAQAKMHYLRTVKAWRLDDLDHLTGSPVGEPGGGGRREGEDGNGGSTFCMLVRNWRTWNSSDGTAITATGFVDMTDAQQLRKLAIVKGSVVTQHSDKYDRKVVDLFLQKRH